MEREFENVRELEFECERKRERKCEPQRERAGLHVYTRACHHSKEE